METIKIKITGQIDQSWSNSLAGLEFTYTADGGTLLSGTIRDQSALYGLLFELSNLGLHIRYVTSEAVKNVGRNKEV